MKHKNFIVLSLTENKDQSRTVVAGKFGTEKSIYSSKISVKGLEQINFRIKHFSVVNLWWHKILSSIFNAWQTGNTAYYCTGWKCLPILLQISLIIKKFCGCPILTRTHMMKLPLLFVVVFQNTFILQSVVFITLFTECFNKLFL